MREALIGITKQDDYDEYLSSPRLYVREIPSLNGMGQACYHSIMNDSLGRQDSERLSSFIGEINALFQRSIFGKPSFSKFCSVESIKNYAAMRMRVRGAM